MPTTHSVIPGAARSTAGLRQLSFDNARSRFSGAAAWLISLAIIAALLVQSGCGGCGEPAFARVSERDGDLTFKAYGAQEFIDAPLEQGLSPGDTVRTGAQSRATIAFAAGGVVKLGPSSELVVGVPDEAGGITLQLGAGEMEVEATGVEFRLLVGNDGEPVILKSGKMMISLTGRGMILAVMDGTGEVERAGKALTILSGQGLNLTEGGGPIDLQGSGFDFTFGSAGGPDATVVDTSASVVADVGPEAAVVDADAVNTADLELDAGDTLSDADTLGDTDTFGDADTFADADIVGDSEVSNGDALADSEVAEPAASVSPSTLVDPSRKVRVREPGTKRYAKPKTSRTPLVAGMGVKAKKGASIEGPGATRVSLGKGASFQWNGSGGGKVRMSLSGGEARVVVRKGQGGARVVTPGAKVEVFARGVTGNTSVRRSRKKTRIAVRVGYADVFVRDRTIRVSGGEVLVVTDAGVIDGPRSVGTARLGAREGKKTRIYYDRRPSRVAFKWGGKAGTPVVLEVARDEAFTQTVIKEPLEATSFTLSSPTGRYYWRVIRNGVPGSVGSLRLSGDPSLGRSSASVKNKVRDTGKETRIYFQGPHPRLSFSWKKKEAAASYQMRLFRSSNLQSPVFKKKTTKNYVSLPPNRLKEGTYFWYHSALDAAGNELSTGQMNKLSLTFDNKLPTLRIDSYRGGRVSGVAARGTGLSLNGKPVKTDASGRFSMSTRGGGPLIFRIKRSSGDTLFVRH